MTYLRGKPPQRSKTILTGQTLNGQYNRNYIWHVHWKTLKQRTLMSAVYGVTPEVTLREIRVRCTPGTAVVRSPAQKESRITQDPSDGHAVGPRIAAIYFPGRPEKCVATEPTGRYTAALVLLGTCAGTLRSNNARGAREGHTPMCRNKGAPRFSRPIGLVSPQTAPSVGTPSTMGFT